MSESNKPKLIRPSDLRRQAEDLVRKGKMPSLEAVLQAVAKAREKFSRLIRQARAEVK